MGIQEFLQNNPIPYLESSEDPWVKYNLKLLQGKDGSEEFEELSADPARARGRLHTRIDLEGVERVEFRPEEGALALDDHEDCTDSRQAGIISI